MRGEREAWFVVRQASRGSGQHRGRSRKGHPRPGSEQDRAGGCCCSGCGCLIMLAIIFIVLLILL